MYLLYALIFIFLLEISGISCRKTEGKLDEKASKKCAHVKERNAEKCVFPFEVAIPRAPRSFRETKKLKIFKNLAADHRRVRSCSECGLVVKGNKEFEQHAFSRHKGMKLVFCEKCDKKFSKFECLYNHKKICHNRSTAKCKFCWKICSLDALEEHEETCMKTANEGHTITVELPNDVKEVQPKWITPTHCEPCDRKFSSHALYKNHCRTSHRGEKIFPCRFCCKRFTSYKYMVVHLEKKHEVEMLQAGERPKKYPRGLMYSCLHCGAVVKGVRKYEQHGRNYHPGRAIFKCAACGEGFRWKNAAERHAKDKHGEDKTCCRFCSKCYFRQDFMKEHEGACGKKIAVVEAKKVRVINKKLNNDRMGRHYCDICNKTMYVLDETFKRHVSTHDDFDYCDMCDHRFERKRYPDGLEKHMKMRHPLRDNVNALLEMARTLRMKFEKTEDFENSEVLPDVQWGGCSTLTSNVELKSECDEDY